MSPLFKEIASGRVLLMDGALGTELQRAGLAAAECAEAWNLLHPDRVRAIHKSYVEAGARILLTNTFQAASARLEACRLANNLEKVWRAAIDLARDEAPADAFVLASLGPVDLSGREEQIETVARECLRADGLLLETLSAVDRGMESLLKRIRDFQPSFPVLLSFTFLKNAAGAVRTRGGARPEECGSLARSLKLDALGVNCGREIGMQDICEVLQGYRTQVGPKFPLFARPNAGTPQVEHGRWVYPQSPEKMAAMLPELLEQGVTMVGGCCGTTPEHIGAFKQVVESWNSR
jgi:5-methyltetrahydrofolate--homocysteine methyltransferase